MATNLRNKLAKLADLPSFASLPFQNGSEYRNANMGVKGAMN